MPGQPAHQSHSVLDILALHDASTDASLEIVRSRHPEIEIIETGSNLGYGGGNNVGLRIALERGLAFALVLKADTILDRDCVARLVDAALDHPEAAALGPKSFLFDRPGRLYSFGGSWDPTGYPRLTGFREKDGPPFQESRETEWLKGCALLICCACLEKVGLFDERFFHTFEDTDWSLRTRHCGFALRVAADAHLGHRISRSLGASRSPD